MNSSRQVPPGLYFDCILNKMGGDPPGKRIRNKQGKPLAAVSLIDKGVVYFNDISADEKFLMANICTANITAPGDLIYLGYSL